MCHSGRFTREQDTFFYEVNPPVVHMAAEIVARDKGITPEVPHRLHVMHWEKRMLINEANLIPLIRNLFRALSKTDFNWEFVDNDALECIEYYLYQKQGEINNTTPR